MTARTDGGPPRFDYAQAFSRNIGWVTPEEQERLRRARVAVGGLGGVGGSHLLTLARLGIGAFSIADIDAFELTNLNRQAGATCSTLGRSKIEVMADQVRDINPEVDLRLFPGGVTLDNVDEFLEGADLYMDSLDLFALEVRRRVFARCRELGIPALTAAPMGMGTALLVFTPRSMSFEDYFAFDEGPLEDQIIRFVIGVSPTVMQRRYLVFRRSVDFTRQKVPSIAMGIEIAAGVACTAALKLLLGRGEVPVAPRGLHFDAYLNRLRVTWRPWGNRNPLQRLMYWRVKRMIRAVWGKR